MKFLVTGGAGFIGSNIAERLLKEKHYVRILDNFSSGKEENLSFLTQYSIPNTQYQIIRGDIREPSVCDKACAGMDYVLHQAALRSVPKSMTRPHDYNAVNIDGTLNILEAALKNKVKRIVLASSSSVYGDATKFPEKETDLPLLISPYALTKLAAEYYSRVFSENYGLETVNLRYFNVFGPRQAVDDEYSVVIPKFITCMLEDKNPPVHGTGKQSRDFTYVDNVVEANILAATTVIRRTRDEGRGTSDVLRPSEADVHRPTEHQGSTFCEVFNVACGSDQTVLQLVDTLNRIMNKTVKPVFEPKRQGDVFRTLADITKIKSMLGYEPRVGFEDGLRRTVEWFVEEQRGVTVGRGTRDEGRKRRPSSKRSGRPSSFGTIV